MKTTASQLLNKANSRQVGGDHYVSLTVQPWNVVDTWPLEQRIGFYRGGALKYLMRMGSKDESAQEIAKGAHYIEKLLEVLRLQTRDTPGGFVRDNSAMIDDWK